MEILYLMIICSVSLAAIFLIIFIISAKNGQFEDDESPAVRVLLEDKNQDFEHNETDDAEKNKTEEKNI